MYICIDKVPKSVGNIKKTKTKKVVHNRPTVPERVNRRHGLARPWCDTEMNRKKTWFNEFFMVLTIKIKFLPIFTIICVISISKYVGIYGFEKIRGKNFLIFTPQSVKPILLINFSGIPLIVSKNCTILKL